MMKLTKDQLDWRDYGLKTTSIFDVKTDYIPKSDIKSARVVVFPARIDGLTVDTIYVSFDESKWLSLKKVVLPKRFEGTIGPWSIYPSSLKVEFRD